MSIDVRSRAALLTIARAAVEDAVARRAPRPAMLDDPPPASGVFVTLTKDGELRGCIGTLECRGPLVDEIARVACSAAVADPRFPPVTPDELPQLHVEISLLGPLEPIDPTDPDAIAIGQHGLVVEQGARRGLLLPQVAPEWGWDRDEFLAHTCRKAGLPMDAWRRGAAVYRFEADVFDE